MKQLSKRNGSVILFLVMRWAGSSCCFGSLRCKGMLSEDRVRIQRSFQGIQSTPRTKCDADCFVIGSNAQANIPTSLPDRDSADYYSERKHY